MPRAPQGTLGLVLATFLQAARRKVRLARFMDMDAFDLVAGRRPPLTPSRALVEAVGGYDFHIVGQHLSDIATTFGALKPHERLLDIGCGVGRLAVPLTRYLTTGEYTGFDISGRAIRWCRKSISCSHPNFWFALADISNSHYNPHGALRPESFRFPCADQSVDIAFAASVFTHLEPASADHYLAETARVLKPGGRAVLSFFLLDPHLISRLGGFYPRFTHFPQPYYAVADQKDPEAAVAYDVAAVAEALRAKGLAVVRIANGHRAQHPDPLSYQDFVLAQRAAA